MIDQHAWKKHMQDIAKELGFAGIGFTGADPLVKLESYLCEREKAGHPTPFVKVEPRERTNPRTVWEACQTVVALAYPLPYTAKPRKGEGIIARSAVGEDYHQVVQRQLEKLVLKMIAAGWSSETPRFQVDTGPLNERAFAVRSGLGWIGRNQQLIIPEVGSFVALALLLLDQSLPPDEPLENLCGTCQKCVQACPAQILGEEHFAASQCVSYLTQSKEFLTEEQGIKVGRRLFGCDTCQETCPHNQAFLKQEEGLNLISRGVDLYEALNLTKAEFNERFRSTAAGWRGKVILQRNAYRIMENLKDERLISWSEENREKKDLPPLLQREIERDRE